MVKDPLSEEQLFKIFKTSPKNPDRLIKREDKNHEFKESYNNAGMAMYLKTMAAFANNDGGYIIFGIKDSPRLLLGLNEKAFQQFSELPVEKLTQQINEYFAPSIEWTNCIYQFRGKSYGIIYIFPLKNKPAICKKSNNSTNNKYSLKEADIYYRYSGRSERIKYPELQKIIDQKRQNEEKQWLKFLMKAARIGVENASLLDLSRGEITEGGNKLVLDENLLEKVRFIKEGQFVERYGAPALRLVGDFKTMEAGKVVYQGTQKIVRAIEPMHIIEAFLNDQSVANPVEYIRRICTCSTGNLPVYYYIGQAGLTKEKTLQIIEETTTRSNAKKILKKKIAAFEPIATKHFPAQENESSRTKRPLVQEWIAEAVPPADKITDVKNYMAAIRYIDEDVLQMHLSYIKSKVLEIYRKYYESSDGAVAGVLREAMCYIDSSEYFTKKSNDEKRV